MSTTNTRLLITSLHPSLTPSLLRSHLLLCPSLSTPSSITDIKLVTRKDGTSRCIAFVGFKTGQEAERVKNWVDGTWVMGERGNGSKVKVEWAKDTKDSTLPASKRQRLDTSTPREQEKGKGKKPEATSSSDSRFQDFLAVMAPPKPSALHDTSTITRIASTTSASASASTTTSQEPEREEEKNSRKRKSTATEPTTVGGEEEEEFRGEEGFINFPNDDAAGDETLTDAEYLAKRMKRNVEQVEVNRVEGAGEGELLGGEGEGKEFEQDEEERGDKDGAEEEGGEGTQAKTPDLTIESILETGRLFLRNLAFSVTSEDLESLFSGYGAIEQVHLPVDRTTNASKGLAYITFTSPQSAVSAYEALDGRTFQGRLLHILPAVGRLAKPDRGGRTEGNALKGERMELRKQTGGKAFSWGTLYLNSNAALSAVADRLGVAKSALLDPSSSSDPAIKVALAEAHTLGEIKQYFENEGVNIASFSKPGPRSSTCILLKNLPYGSTPSSLTHLVAPYGPPTRLLVPPSGTIAIVEMEDSKSASEAWRGLLYKQFGGSVLYLEKAPSGIWEGERSTNNTTSNSSSITPVTSSTAKTSSQGDSTSGVEGSSSSSSSSSSSPPGATLFIKNLNFITTSTRLESISCHLSGYSFSRIQTKPDPKTPGRTLSMGYGFIGFKTVGDATKAKEVLEKQVLDGHQLEVKFAQRGTTTNEESKGGGSSSSSSGKKSGGKGDETTTKMLVKNVPFEATRKELRQLFSAYGQLKSVRLPRKMDNTTRGFAFLDFATRRDAESAFSALEHAHLLGRHLVLQWAGGEDDPEGSGQGKAGRGQMSLDGGRKLNHKKSKFTMDTTE